MTSRLYCTNPEHGDGEHDKSCTPPADPGNPELRLIRAIFGLCPDCDNPDDHEHPCAVCGSEQPEPDGSYHYHGPNWKE